MATIKKYNGSTWENAVVRKYGTASEIITPPTTIYADGQSITTYSIKGNTTQSGTPTPSNPVTVNGVGERTENLFDEDYPNISSSIQYLPVYVGDVTVTMSTTCPRVGTVACLWLLEGDVSSGASGNNNVYEGMNRTVTAIDGYITIAYRTTDGVNPSDYKTMLNLGQTALPYEKHGLYKISILKDLYPLTPMYFSQQLMLIDDTTDSVISSGTATYQIGSYELTGQENWYIYEAVATTPYPIYQFYTSGLNLDGVPRESAYCTIAPYGLTASTRQNGEYGAYMVSSGADIGLQMYGSKSQFPDVTAWQTYLQQQYANGTPVTIYYVKSTPTTETVTVPTIPTTDGANSITVDTTVQPSEFTATWTGWHDANVKEWDGSQWQ